MDDTVAHLESFDQLQQFFFQCKNGLVKNGKLVLSYRDYGLELLDSQRFIPVKADENKILAYFLGYFEDKVSVTDLLQEKINGEWVQKASSYFKIRITDQLIKQWLTQAGVRNRKDGNYKPSELSYCKK